MAYFVTGATGFIGRHLVQELLDHRDGEVFVLVREVRRRLDALVRSWGVPGRVTPVTGDLGSPGLGVDPAWVEEHRGSVEHFFHLAALYDMTAPDDLNEQLNVGGTRAALGSRPTSTPASSTTSRPSPPPVTTPASTTRACSTSGRACRRRTTGRSSSPSGSSARSPRCPGGSTARRSSWATPRPGRWTRSTGPTTSSRCSSGCATASRSGCPCSAWTSATPTSSPSTTSPRRWTTSPTSRGSTARRSTWSTPTRSPRWRS